MEHLLDSIGRLATLSVLARNKSHKILMVVFNQMIIFPKGEFCSVQIKRDFSSMFLLTEKILRGSWFTLISVWENVSQLANNILSLCYPVPLLKSSLFKQ